MAIALFVYFKTKDKTIQHYLYLYIPFTIVIVLYMAVTYIGVNIPSIQPEVLEILQYLATISLLSLIFFVPVCVHHFNSIPNSYKKNVMFGYLTILAFMGYHIDQFILTDVKFSHFGEYLLNGIFIIVMLYCALIDIKSFRIIRNPSKKKFAQWGTILFSFSLPGLMYDLFLDDYFPFRIYPILYCGLSIIFTIYYLSHLHHPFGNEKKTLPKEDLFKKFNISSREQDIINLVLKGYSNQKIAAALCISLHTVKTHLKNIYPKMG
ncbi:MAG: helix-turn-helix transcriptional regulator, partial [Desulfobacteraceae bacterium]